MMDETAAERLIMKIMLHCMYFLTIRFNVPSSHEATFMKRRRGPKG
jgi:hypothetical protein